MIMADSQTDKSSESGDDDSVVPSEDDKFIRTLDHTAEGTKVRTMATGGPSHERKKSETGALICQARWDFSGVDYGDLSFERGELLTILGIRKDGWWEAKNSAGERGLVPSTFIKVPDHMKPLIKPLIERVKHSESYTFKKPEFRDFFKKSHQRSHYFNSDLHKLGAPPTGFRKPYLLKLLKEDSRYSFGTFLMPKLGDCGLAFQEYKWEETFCRLKSKVTLIQKEIHLIALREILIPPFETFVTGRLVRMCLHNGTEVLSNIHTVRAKCDSKNPRLWTFDIKISPEDSCIDDGAVFIRCNKFFATLGILFELSVCYESMEAEFEELSCGWCFMRLLNDSGFPIKSRTKILKVHDSVPFTSPGDTSRANAGPLKQLIGGNTFPRMVVSISNPTHSSNHHVSFLPSILIGPVSILPILSLARKVLAEDLLDRTASFSVDPIVSPILSTLPYVFNEHDIVDVLRQSWFERTLSRMSDTRIEAFKKIAFRSVFLRTVFVLCNCDSLPPYVVGNRMIERARWIEISRLVKKANSYEGGGRERIVRFDAVSFSKMSLNVT